VGLLVAVCLDWQHNPLFHGKGGEIVIEDLYFQHTGHILAEDVRNSTYGCLIGKKYEKLKSNLITHFQATTLLVPCL
jgi:hypothetical protein